MPRLPRHLLSQVRFTSDSDSSNDSPGGLRIGNRPAKPRLTLLIDVQGACTKTICVYAAPGVGSLRRMKMIPGNFVPQVQTVS